ncbi:hypothetical protein [Lacticaseibacillus kribbianus]|uniref:hypothetical protein n=1 Tax=Lacticaseibacillus kribbianus TaxID=2926292 RepID=UPI001CD4702A|nr:hypothetical protein [Lacticaseibacillus kribbianus]
MTKKKARKIMAFVVWLGGFISLSPPIYLRVMYKTGITEGKYALGSFVIVTACMLIGRLLIDHSHLPEDDNL